MSKLSNTHVCHWQLVSQCHRTQAALADQAGYGCEVKRMHCKRGTGGFQWNTGGWFGAQVGSTCWLFVAAISFLRQTPLLAALLLGCFVLANLAGTMIWMNRGKIDPYRAIQVLLLVIFAFTTIALVSADWFGFLGEIDLRVKNPRLLYLVLLMFPALMTMFHFQNRVKSRETRTNS